MIEVLRRTGSLETLNISCNFICDEGMRKVVEDSFKCKCHDMPVPTLIKLAADEV